MTLTPGTTVGRYQILEPLGQGGMATVYKALQPSLQREVALKVLRPGYAQDQEFRERFEREAIAIAKLRHPHIVQVFDFEAGQSGEYVLAMEFLEGGTLKDRLVSLAGEGRGMDPEQAVRIIGEVAEALGYAHEKGIVHRDVKPSNVMLTHRDRAVVTDFGIARILGATSHTQTGVGIGTPEYMAPEQGQGSAIDHRADIYSLGAMAYELLTGRVPYTADTPLAVVLAHIKDPLPLPSKVNPTIGKGVERTLLKALAKDPAQRFDSATAFADQLKAGLAEDSRGGTLPTVVVRGPAGAAVSVRTRVAPAAVAVPGALSRRPVQLGLAGALLFAIVSGSVLASGALRGPAASSAPSAAPTAATSGGPATPARGTPLWQAKLDGTDIDTRGASSLYINATEDSSSVRFAPGAIEFVVNKTPTGRTVALNSPIRDTFFLEVDVDSRVAGQLALGWWATGSNPQFRLIADTQQSRMEFQYYHSRVTTQPLSASTAASEVRSGAPFTLALAVEKDRFTAFAAGKQVVQIPADPRIPPATVPITLSFGLSSGTQTGVVRVTGIRLYEVASTAAAAAATATPTPRPIATPGATWGNPPQEMQTRLAQFSVKPQVARVGDMVTLSLDVGAAWACDGTVQPIGLNYAQVARPSEAQLMDWSPKSFSGRADAKVDASTGSVRWTFGTPPAMPPNCPPGTAVNTQPVGLKLTATYQILKPTNRWDAVYAEAQNNQGTGFAQLPFGVVSD